MARAFKLAVLDDYIRKFSAVIQTAVGYFNSSSAGYFFINGRDFPVWVGYHGRFAAV
jgi:hypothetical protein